MLQQFLAAAARGRRVPRKGFTALNSKRGPRTFYKGKGAEPTGHHTRKGKTLLEVHQPADDLTQNGVIGHDFDFRWLPDSEGQATGVHSARLERLCGMCCTSFACNLPFCKLMQHTLILLCLQLKPYVSRASTKAE